MSDDGLWLGGPSLAGLVGDRQTDDLSEED